MKLKHAIAIILCGMVSPFVQAGQWVSIGKYSLSGTLQDGSIDMPGLIAETSPGRAYRGLALDEPLNITHITVGVDTNSWPVLERGQLDHIQMVMNKNNAISYKELYGKHVIVDCSIDFVGRYHTPIFCSVNKITLAPENTASGEAATKTVTHPKKHSVISAKTKSLFDTLSYCVVPTAQYGQYSSYDGGKSPGNILLEKCGNEFLAWKKSCMADGGTEDSCLAEGFVYVQSALKKFNK